MNLTGRFASRSLAVFLAVSCIASAPMSSAFADALPNNPAGGEVELVNPGDSMMVNDGCITENNGFVETNSSIGYIEQNDYQVAINNGEIAANNATVLVNNGIVQDNWNCVGVNDGVIVNNYSVNVGYSEDDDPAVGQIINNYVGGEFDFRCWGQNNFFGVEDFRNIDGLDWSLNDDLLTSSKHVYVGASSNPENLQGAIFRAKEGFLVDATPGSTDEFSLVQNEDGTYGITVLDESITWVKLGSMVKIKALTWVDVTADHYRGGVVLSEYDNKFQPGYYDLNHSFLSLTAVANNGYRFVGWESSSDGYDLLAYDNRLVIRDNSIGSRFLGIKALFVRSQSSYDDGVVGGGDPADKEPVGEGGSDALTPDDSIAPDSSLSHPESIPLQAAEGDSELLQVEFAKETPRTGDVLASFVGMATAAVVAGAFLALRVMRRHSRRHS